MSKSRVGSLGRRLSTWLALQSLLGLVAVSVIVYAVAHLSFSARQLETLDQKQALVRHLMTEAAGTRDVPALLHKLDDFSVGRTDLNLSLRWADGDIFYESTAAAPAAMQARQTRFTVPSPTVPPETLTATLTLATNDDQLLLRRLAYTLLASALLGSLLISAGGFLLVGLGLRPLRKLVEQTRQLAADTLHQRLDGSAQPEELEPLIGQFNDLLARLSLAYEQLEGFNADVAHELCTPLATLIGSTELALRKARDADELREVLGSNLEELQRLSGIVHDMLFLSQADRGTAARRLPTASLAAVATAVAEYHEAALEDAGLRWHVEGDAAGEFDLPLLRRALSNLLSNAARYAEAGTTVRLQVAALGDGIVRLTVLNQGPTINPAHLPRLFDRFYRGDQSRSHADKNHGLGLAIVAAVARMHGGHCQATSMNGSTAVSLSLQATAASLPPHP